MPNFTGPGCLNSSQARFPDLKLNPTHRSSDLHLPEHKIGDLTILTTSYGCAVLEHNETLSWFLTALMFLVTSEVSTVSQSVMSTHTRWRNVKQFMSREL